MSEREFATLMEDVVRHLRQDVPAVDLDRWSRDFWRLGGFIGGRLDNAADFNVERGRETEGYLDLLRDHAPADAGFEPVVDALSRSRIVALEPNHPDDSGFRRWAVSWCLPPGLETDPPIATALAASGIRPFAAEPSRRGLRRMVDESNGTTAALTMGDAPAVVAPIGRTTRLRVPEPIALPAGFPQIRERLEATVRELVRVSRFGFDDADDLELLVAPEPADRPERHGRRVLVEADDEGTRVHPYAVGALVLAEHGARDALAPFVTARYELRIRFAPLEQWVEGAPIFDVSLADRDEPGNRFDAEAVADGLALWVQLAVLQGAELVARGTERLSQRVSDAWAAREDARSPGPVDEDRGLADASRYAMDALEAELDRLNGLAAGDDDGAELAAELVVVPDVTRPGA